MKTRHKAFDLGDLSAGGYSKEVDLGSFSHAWIYFRTPSSGTTSLRVEVAPEEHGETPTWHTFGKEVTVTSTLTRVCAPLPLGVGTDYLVPARMRVYSSTAITELFIEGIRDLP